jgi:hypothetical protein
LSALKKEEETTCQKKINGKFLSFFPSDSEIIPPLHFTI